MARNPRCTSRAAGQAAWHGPRGALWIVCLLQATVLLNVACVSAQEVATTGTADPTQIAQLGLNPSSLPKRRAVIRKALDTPTSDKPAPIVKVDKPRQRSAAGAARMAAQLQAQITATTPAGLVTPMAMDPTYQTILDKHNTYRSWHQVGAVTWADNLASAAASYAAGCNFVHDPNAHAGENLWAISTVGDVAGALSRAIDDWYNEVSLYSFTSPGFGETTGHFTQVVWKGTSLLGCAAASCTRGLGGIGWSQATFVVCRYSPAGNVLGQFQNNVFPRTSGGTTPPVTPPSTPTPAPPPTSPIPPATLPGGWRFSSPGCLYSVSQRFRLCMQNNGQVVLIDGSSSAITWFTNRPATGNAPFRLNMQTDGNLVVSDAFGRVAWSTGAPGRGTPPYKMVVQDNGNVVVSDSLNQRMWATNPALP